MDKTEQLISFYHTGFVASLLIAAAGIVLMVIFWGMYYRRTGRIAWWS